MEWENQRRIWDEIARVTDESAPGVVDGWVKLGRKYVRRMRRYQRGFNRRLTKSYGQGFELLLVFQGVAMEIGDSLANSEVEGDARALQAALRGLHARACRVMGEVIVLAAHGFGQGALARSRTLHEMAVISIVLSDHSAAHPDLPGRYMDHDGVLNYQDALMYQEHAEVLGYEPFAQEDMAELLARRNELLAKYGVSYKTRFGWAAPLCSGEPTFRLLEELAEQSHLRGHYMWSTREVHSDSKGLRLNSITRGDDVLLLTGPSNLGIADPVSIAASALMKVTTFYALKEMGESITMQLRMQALQLLLGRLEREFVDGERAIEDAEAALHS